MKREKGECFTSNMRPARRNGRCPLLLLLPAVPPPPYPHVHAIAIELDQARRRRGTSVLRERQNVGIVVVGARRCDGWQCGWWRHDFLQQPHENHHRGQNNNNGSNNGSNSSGTTPPTPHPHVHAVAPGLEQTQRRRRKKVLYQRPDAGIVVGGTGGFDGWQHWVGYTRHCGCGGLFCRFFFADVKRGWWSFGCCQWWWFVRDGQCDDSFPAVVGSQGSEWGAPFHHERDVSGWWWWWY